MTTLQLLKQWRLVKAVSASGRWPPREEPVILPSPKMEAVIAGNPPTPITSHPSAPKHSCGVHKVGLFYTPLWVSNIPIYSNCVLFSREFQSIKDAWSLVNERSSPANTVAPAQEHLSSLTGSSHTTDFSKLEPLTHLPAHPSIHTSFAMCKFNYIHYTGCGCSLVVLLAACSRGTSFHQRRFH